MSFSFNIEQNNPVNIISPVGRLMDIDDQKKLIEAVEQLIKNGSTSVVLNLEGLEYMNSSGINSFISILTKTRNAGGDTIICCVPKKIEQLLVITKLNSVFNVATTLDEAVSKFSENIKA
jgi:anti-sigma B factor antagonist